MHPTYRESMLLTVQQEDPDSSNNDSVKPDNVSEDELDMILATMGTTSLKDSEMAILQDDASVEEQGGEESDPEKIDEESEQVQHVLPDASAPPQTLTPQAPTPQTPTPQTPTPQTPTAPESHLSSEDAQPSSRMSARRVVKNFFKKLRNAK